LNTLPIKSAKQASDVVCNIGNSIPVVLMDYIGAIEKALGMEAKKNFMPLQDGDVPEIYANVDDLV